MPVKSKEHKAERIVRLLTEKFNHDLQNLLTWAKTDDGRYMFNVLLTQQEQLQRFRDPMTRQQIEANMSPEEVQAYHDKMLNASIHEAVKES